MADEKETASKPRREEINNGQALDIVTTMITLVFITGWNGTNVILLREFTGNAVMQLVEAPCYKPESRGFHCR
jgi:hypothetical protein